MNLSAIDTLADRFRLSGEKCRLTTRASSIQISVLSSSHKRGQGIVSAVPVNEALGKPHRRFASNFVAEFHRLITQPTPDRCTATQKPQCIRVNRTSKYSVRGELGLVWSSNSVVMSDPLVNAPYQRRGLNLLSAFGSDGAARANKRTKSLP